MITYAALSPHPPLIIPYIGGERIREVASTVDGIRAMAREMADSAPETIVFLTPHGNVFSDCISFLSDSELYGDFSLFGSQEKGTRVKNDLNLMAKIGKIAVDAGINMLAVDGELARNNGLNPSLDHGILVPLYYIQEAGLKDIPIVAISIGFLEVQELYVFGKAIQDAAEQLGKRIAVLASGDMSHRLKNEGPYDYHPDGLHFDQRVKTILETADVDSLLNMPLTLRENAGQCGYPSLIIMFGALDGIDFEPRIFSYEGPFGVGYLNAGFFPRGLSVSILDRLEEEKREKTEEKRQSESMQVRWARMVLESYIRDGNLPELPAEMMELREEKAGAFVSLKKNGQLRGCIGTIMSAYGDLAEEIKANAISAGTRDPRFLPVKQGELDELLYSVDILGDPEPCRKEDLDPHKFGVIVSQGSKRGLLLPDLEGVNTVEEQLAIALQKAGIPPGELYSLERFEVKRFT